MSSSLRHLSGTLRLRLRPPSLRDVLRGRHGSGGGGPRSSRAGERRRPRGGGAKRGP